MSITGDNWTPGKINIKNLFLWLVTIYPGSHGIQKQSTHVAIRCTTQLNEQLGRILCTFWCYPTLFINFELLLSQFQMSLECHTNLLSIFIKKNSNLKHAVSNSLP